ncbi:type II secretion system F family protein [Streptomyces boninensis]|uniref:type II secretion system F family protein n=1 Tax=Streptomyces boninensis TaxID=2039455 RepID=UPI003B222DDE
MAITCAAAAYCTADAVAAAWRARRLRRRAAVLLGTADGPAGAAGEGRAGLRAASGRLGLLRRWLGEPVRWAPYVSGVAVLILAGGVAGCVAGLAVAYGIRRWLRRQLVAGAGGAGGAGGGRGRAGGAGAVGEGVAGGPVSGGVVVAELPLAAELLGACLAAGAGPLEAAAAVGRSLDGPVAERLAQGAGEVRLGGDPRAAWSRLAAIPGAEGLAACLEHAGVTGAPVVDAVSRLAADARAERGRAATARARRAAVLVSGPLGLCFLPAFLAVGVAPVVIGLTARLLQST